MVVYLIRRKGTNEYKIGLSENANKRLGHLQTANAQELELICQCKKEIGDDVFESFLHRKYNANRKIREWFLFTDEEIKSVMEEFEDGKTECYKNSLPIGRGSAYDVRQVSWGQQHTIACSGKDVSRRQAFGDAKHKPIQPPLR